MEYKDLIVERNGHIMTVIFDRPHALNALSQEMLDSQAAVCEEINRDDEIRVVIFTGAGRGFCSGIDLKHTDMTNSRLERLEMKPVGPVARCSLSNQSACGWLCHRTVTCQDSGIGAPQPRQGAPHLPYRCP